MKDTKSELLYRGIELFKTKGYEKVSVNELCQSLGLTKGAFYHHYPSKDALLLDYYQVQLADFTDVIEKTTLETASLAKIWQLICLLIDASIALGPELLKALIEADLNQGNQIFSPYNFFQLTHLPLFKTILIETIEQLKNEHVIEAYLATEEQLFLFFASVHVILMKWAATGGDIPVKSEIEAIFRQLFH